MSKNYLITGAARGIGRGLTRLLLAKGHRVLALDNDKRELDHLATQLPRWIPGSSAASTESWRTMHCDVSSNDGIAAAATTASEFFAGQLDVLVNNAAYTAAVGSVDVTSADFPAVWERAVAVNLTGPVMLTRACVPILRRGGGRTVGGSVVMVSSTRAYQSEANSEGYAATKAGLLGLTHALACSLAESGTGIRVNAVLPGWINVVDESREGDEKGMKWEDGLSEEDMRWHWAGRVGKVEDVLRAVEYLSGDGEDGSFITGTEMVVDGGVTRRMVYPE